MRVSERAVTHPITTIMLFITMAALGVISLSRIGMELFPDVSYPTAAIITIDPGVGPFEVESGVTKPIEDAVSTISGVDKVTSTSAEGVSLVIVNFSWDTAMGSIVSDIREKITSIEDQLPEESERPMIFRFNPEVLPCLTFSVSSATEGLDLRRLVEKEVVPELVRLLGVASCDVTGGREAAVTVRLDLDSLSKKKIPVTQILQVFRGENVNLPGGSISLKDRYLVLRTIGEFSTLEDIENVLVGYRENVPVYLRDVAEVALASLPQEQFVRAAGTRSVQVDINKMQGHNTVQVIQRAKNALKEVQASLPASVKIGISSDQSVSIIESIGGVTDAAWQGGLLAVLVLVIFLRNLRSTLIIALAIPVSVVATFVLMDFAKINLNIMSLAGLTLGVGMFVDNSIVVLEVIFRKLLSGMSPREAATAGAGEVSMAVTASTLTNLVVFLPIVFITGFANIIMRDLAYTISFAMVVSLIMALTLVPVLCVRFLRMQKGAKVIQRTAEDGKVDLEVSLADIELHTGNRPVDWVAKKIQNAIQALDTYYERALRWAIRRAALVIVIAVGLLGLSVLSIYTLGLEFLPETDEGRMAIDLETKVESPYARTEEKVAQIEKIVLDNLGTDLVTISSVIGQGGSTGGLGETGSHLGRISLTLVNKDSRTRSIWKTIEDLSSAIRLGVTDVKFAIRVTGLSSLVSLAAGSENPVVVELAGEDLVASEAFAQRVAAVMEATPGTRDVAVSFKTGKPEIQFKVKRREAASLGLSPLEIAGTIRAAYKGMAVSRFRTGDDTYDVYLMLRDEDRNSLERISSLFVVNAAGTKIPIENVVDIVSSTGPVAIERVAKTRMVKVVCSLSGQRALNKVVEDVRQGVEALGRPPSGIRLAIAGSSQQMGDAFTSLFFALLLGMGLVYVVMANQFESLLHPLIVMFSIPFALIGLTAALLVTNTTFSLVAFIGAILLVGYVVNNGIVLVDYMNVLRRKGLALDKAVFVGGRTRLKPIIMSTGTTFLGLLPMALGLGTGAELRAPMARAVAGGLASSTLITLILIPVIYYLVESKLRRRTSP